MGSIKILSSTTVYNIDNILKYIQTENSSFKNIKKCFNTTPNFKYYDKNEDGYRNWQNILNRQIKPTTKRSV